MIVPPMPWRCSAGIPALVNERLAISPSTYDSVNFFEPITTGSAPEAEKAMRNAGTQENLNRKSRSQETRNNRQDCFAFLALWFPDSFALLLSCFPTFLIRFI